VDDYAEFAGDVRAKFAGGPGAPPAFAAGQSMGGLLATHLVLRDQAAWAGLILCSAAIDLEWNLVTRRAPRPSRPACPLHAWMGTCRSRRAAGRPGPGSCMNMRGMTNVVQSLAMQLSLLHTLPSWRPGQPRSRAAKQVVHAAAASPAVLCAAATRSGPARRVPVASAGTKSLQDRA
jgi:alpha-beta hydrolase superfamily lysophospholipase